MKIAQYKNLKLQYIKHINTMSDVEIWHCAETCDYYFWCPGVMAPDKLSESEVVSLELNNVR